MSEMLRGQTWDHLSDWDGMVTWLVQSCGALDIADVLEIGPSHYAYEDDDGNEVVPCAQLQKLAGDVVWLRVSMQFLHVPLLSEYSSDGLTLDAWHDGSIFDDCTDGFIVSDDFRMLAGACVSWFRDRQEMQLAELGCEHHRARSLRES